MRRMVLSNYAMTLNLPSVLMPAAVTHIIVRGVTLFEVCPNSGLKREMY